MGNLIQPKQFIRSWNTEICISAEISHACKLISSTTLVSKFVLKIIIKTKKLCLACFKEVRWMTIITCLLHSLASSDNHEMTCALQEDSMILNNLHRRAEINNILLIDTLKLFVAGYLFNWWLLTKPNITCTYKISWDIAISKLQILWSYVT